jgi:hypothetical protein
MLLYKICVFTGVCVISQEMLMESNTNECNAKDDQCKMSILTLEHNTDMRLVESSATDVEARKVITLLQYMMKYVNIKIDLISLICRNWIFIWEV